MPALYFLATIIAANWAVVTFGIVPVGFGLMAPAAVYFVGLSFIFRDMVQEHYGKSAAYKLILIGTALSALINPAIAVASGAAFFASEVLDLQVYTRLRKRGMLKASLASNVVGAVVDSLIFLAIAFGSYQFLLGQVVGKLLLGTVILVTWRVIREVLSRRDRRELAT